MTVLSLTTAVLALGLGTAAIPHDKASWKSNIKNVVVLVEENRSFDTFLGGLTYNPKLDGVVRHPYCNPANVRDPNNTIEVCAKPEAKNIAPDDPNHSISGGNMQVYSTYHPNETLVDQYHDHYQGELPLMSGFVTEQEIAHNINSNISRCAEVINYYTPEHIPVFDTLAQNFLVFDRWFASVPGPTNPNRAYITSGTSHGHGKNDVAFDISALPQRSIFQQLSEANVTWINYSNTTGFLPDALFYDWTVKSGKNDTNIKPLAQFYKDAESGSLPQFTYINPECCSYTSFHPPSPINMGESFVKSVYEALRSSPQWENTLFILTFDEHGGFADHVPPPVGVPPGDNLTYTELAGDGKPITFDFRRLGIRVPTLLISPWIEKGVVENKPAHGKGEYTHTSIAKFIAHLWDLDYLTPRVEWSSSFEGLISKKFRNDTPATLPEPADF